MKKSELDEILDELKRCIDLGHDFKLVSSHPAPEYGGESCIMAEWKCKRCNYTKLCPLPPEAKKTVAAYKELKP